VLFTFNLLSLYQHQGHARPAVSATGNAAGGLFLWWRGAGVMGHDAVVKLSAAWGGLRKHKAAGGRHVGLAQQPVAEVDSPCRPAAIGGGMI